METISCERFRREIEINPSWASRLTEPLEITDFCDMQGTEITHLSPLLHFTGKDRYGDCASFAKCKSLEAAQGNYTGAVNFAASSIKEIKNLTCGKNEKGTSVSFAGCKSLKVAKGTYPGLANFCNSEIEKIENLTCGENNQGNSAFFWACKALKVAEGNFSGYVEFAKSGIRKIGNLTCGKSNEGASAYFSECEFLEIAEGTYPGCVSFTFSGIKEIRNLTCGENDRGLHLNVIGCGKLVRIPVDFNPKKIEADSKLLEMLRADRLKAATIRHLQTKIVEI